MRYRKLIAVGFLGVGALTVLAVRAQQKPALTAMDYIEIQQLANRYAQAIDSCSNNGYDYADLYTPDGEFIDNITEEGFTKHGLVRAKGREQLAAAAGGGSLGCRNVGWKDWSHLMVNHVITPTPEGSQRTRLPGGDRREGSARCNSIRRIRGPVREDFGRLAHQEAHACAE